jgi:hypothetical protein
VALAHDKYLSKENHLLARESLERAVEPDPDFDEAWAHLSWIYSDEFVWEFNPLPDSMKRTLDAARLAIQLAPMNYHNHWLLSRSKLPGLLSRRARGCEIRPAGISGRFAGTAKSFYRGPALAADISCRMLRHDWKR